MISHKHQCIFVHIRKSAGTSVKGLFEDRDDAYNDGILDQGWNKWGSEIDGYYKFAVVRNPWDRFVSGWQYCDTTKQRSIHDVLKNMPQVHLRDNIFCQNVSLISRWVYTKELTRINYKQLIYNLNKKLGRPVKTVPINQGHDYRHLTRQQYESIIYSDGTLAVDQVIYMEDLEQGLLELAEKININPKKIKTKNVRRHRDDYRKYFDQEALALFYKVFHRDIEFLGYSFDQGPGVKPDKPLQPEKAVFTNNNAR